MRPFAFVCAAILASVSAAFADEPPAREERPTWPGMTRSGNVLLPNGWSLRPAGTQTPLGDFPIAIAEHPSAPVLAILHAGYGEHEILTLDAKTRKTLGRVSIPETFGGIVWNADGSRLYVGGGFDEVVYRFDHAGGLLSNRATIDLQAGAIKEDAKIEDGEPLVRAQRGARAAVGSVAGLALSGDGKTLWVADAFGHKLRRLDTETGKPGKSVEFAKDTYPYGLRLDEDHDRIYISLWGASKVAIVDITVDVLLGDYPTEEHPNEMVTTKKGDFLFVANANRNTVTVFDTHKGQAIETIGTAIDPKAPPGSTPNSLALSPDESLLFVANANTNDIAVINVQEAGKSSPQGFIPAGWYPTSVRVARDGKTVYIANGKGLYSMANREGPNPLAKGGSDKTRQYIGGLLRGSLSSIPMPTPAAMAGYSRTVYECSPIDRSDPTAVTGPKPAEGNPIPSKVGDPSPITHCIYIIKENRTYDQVFGDIPEGNGEPELCLFPEKVTPNLHALVREFVILDNFYVDAEVSADGHEWTMGAYATDFIERTWPLSYRGDKRVPYPAEGKMPIAFPASGYLWDRAAAKDVSYRSYGEFVNNPVNGLPAFTLVKALIGHFDPLFHGYDLNYPDVKRADRFLEELADFEKTGDMPRLIVMRLPNDHTSGTRVGAPTPSAMVADNDLAVGKVVEGLSKSRFWPHLAIFIVEDDAQNGSDHVDAHRTTALAISPYIKRKSVDSTMYSTSSMLRTIELILGLDPMSQFDASARPMSNAFASTPDLTAYRVRPPGIDLHELNAPDAPGAAASAKLNLDKEDQADDLVFNEIIWHSVRGPSSPMPPPVRAAFVIPRPKADDDDDDEHEKDEDD
jgi:DNA-binding beta-propeller fold protein YncE